jgi:GNAT superfamily N-acetyltransferase
MLVAELHGSPVGLAKLSFLDKPWGVSCEIGTLVVVEGHRGERIGTRLLTQSEDIARNAGAKAMRVDVLIPNSRGRVFYERAGYEPIAVRYGKPLADERQ